MAYDAMMPSNLALFDRVLDVLVAACAGLAGQDRLERRRMERLFESLPITYGNSDCCQQHSANWTQQFGQDSVETLPTTVSQVSPWKTVNCSITYRHRYSSSDPATTTAVAGRLGLHTRKTSQDQICNIKQLSNNYKDQQLAIKPRQDLDGHNIFARSFDRSGVRYEPVDKYYPYPAEWLGEAGMAPHVHLPLTSSVADGLRWKKEVTARSGKHHAEEQKKRLQYWGSIEGAAVLAQDCDHCLVWLFHGGFAIRDAKFARSRMTPSFRHMSMPTSRIPGTSIAFERKVGIQKPTTRRLFTQPHGNDQRIPASNLTTPSNDTTRIRKYQVALRELWNTSATAIRRNAIRRWSTSMKTVMSTSTGQLPTAVVRTSAEDVDVVVSYPRPISGSQGGRYKDDDERDDFYKPTKRVMEIVYQKRHEDAIAKLKDLRKHAQEKLSDCAIAGKNNPVHLKHFLKCNYSLTYSQNPQTKTTRRMRIRK